MAETEMMRLQEVIGLDLPDEELAHELAAFADIAAAIRRLRALDLTEVHPVVIYDPTLPYRSGEPPGTKP
jgi:hypothetical protein